MSEWAGKTGVSQPVPRITPEWGKTVEVDLVQTRAYSEAVFADMTGFISNADYDNGLGQIIDCDIFENSQHGVAIMSGADPTVRDCRINNNYNSAVYAHDKARGTVERCDLTENVEDTFDIDATSTIIQHDNIPQGSA
jgi:parallel beta-helix repeat protein